MISQRKKHPVLGFTLVELAIVITIIGLLIGGVLKGQEMIQNARVSATIAQVNSYQAAIEAFKDRYDNFPGDFSYARSKLPNCDDNTYCQNGNGNGRVNRLSNPADGVAWSSVIATNTDWSEATQFWKHLALADLISGVNSQADPTAPAWGQTHPSAPTAGGFEFWYDSAMVLPGESFPGRSAFVLRLSKTGISGGPLGTVGESAVTPRIAAQIDRKMDDGVAVTGYVYANYGRGGDDNCRSVTTGYLETDTRLTCEVFFQMSGR